MITISGFVKTISGAMKKFRYFGRGHRIDATPDFFCCEKKYV